MSVTVNSVHRTKIAIYRVIMALLAFSRVKLTHDDDYNVLYILHGFAFVPDFKLVWNSVCEHYCVYILIGTTTEEKRSVGYPIMTIANGVVAGEFVAMYSLIHRHRSNMKYGVAG